MKWTHRPTWPDDPASHGTDRLVLRDGEQFGRVMQEPFGAREGQWAWSRTVTTLPGHNGHAETLEDALDALRRVGDG